MLEKWKQRAIQMNFKRAVLAFAASSFIMILGLSAALYGNFKGRMEQWESAIKTNREYKNGEKGDEHNDHNLFAKGDYKKEHSGGEMEFEQIWKESYLSTGDIVLIAGCGIIVIGFAAWYWLLCMVWAYRKSMRMGTNSEVWVLATFFFNLAAIAILYFYDVLKGTCDYCGRIYLSGSKYCDRCGKPLVKECPDCGQIVSRKADYCRNCGKKLDRNEEA